MHNLFLGTVKKMLEIWQHHGLLNRHHFDRIQSCVNSVNILPILAEFHTHGFSDFIADHFKSWVNIYSIPALVKILPEVHLECWRHFVLPCRILCNPTLEHTLLLKCCQKVETLYGPHVITPTMHMHCHLVEVVKSDGPKRRFWLFSYER